MINLSYLVDLSYWWWAGIASIVSVLSWIYVFKGTREHFERWLIYLGMALAWTGDALNKIWFGFNRLVGFPEWMISHWFVLVISSLILIGATIHIRALSLRLEKLSNVGKLWFIYPIVALLISILIIYTIKI